MGLNKSVITLGNNNHKVLQYLSTKDNVAFKELDQHFNWQGNGIYIKKLLELKMVDKIKRGVYCLSYLGKMQLKILDEISRSN